MAVDAVVLTRSDLSMAVDAVVSAMPWSSTSMVCGFLPVDVDPEVGKSTESFIIGIIIIIIDFSCDGRSQVSGGHLCLLIARPGTATRWGGVAPISRIPHQPGSGWRVVTKRENLFEKGKLNSNSRGR